jgi:hypothetical protein
MELAAAHRPPQKQPLRPFGQNAHVDRQLAGQTHGTWLKEISLTRPRRLS